LDIFKFLKRKAKKQQEQDRFFRKKLILSKEYIRMYEDFRAKKDNVSGMTIALKLKELNLIFWILDSSCEEVESDKAYRRAKEFILDWINN
jgi:hypothetical protein